MMARILYALTGYPLTHSHLELMDSDHAKLFAALDTMHAASSLDARRAVNHLVHEFEVSAEDANIVLRLWLRRLLETSGPAYGEGTG